MSYTPPSGTLAATWVGQLTYTPPSGVMVATWGDPQTAVPGIASTGAFGTASVVLEYQAAFPAGIAPADTFGLSTASREGEYVPPGGTLNASWFGADTYTPPSGTLAATWFNPDPGLYPTGFQSSAFGTLAITSPYILPTGFASSAFGTGTVENTAQGLLPGGIAPPPNTGPAPDRQVPTPWISFRTRYLLPPSMTGVAFPTTHYVADYFQYIDLEFNARGIAPGSVGTPVQVVYGVRYIEPPFLFETTFGSHLVYFPVEITPTGIAPSDLFGTAQLDIDLQRILPPTIGSTSEPGVPALRNAREFVVPEDWTSSEIGFPTVYNLTQVVLAGPYAGTSDPEIFGQYLTVENIDREIRAAGHPSSRVSMGAWVYNAARAILPAGLDATIWGPDTFIAYRIRTLPLPSLPDPYFSPYVVVYNDAQVVGPFGFAPSVFGIPTEVLNLRRTVRQSSPYAGPLVGTAFVAPGVRTIVQKETKAPNNGTPEIRLNPYPIAPPGAVPPQFGAPDVVERFTIIRPVSTNVSDPKIGQPVVLNRNRELRLSLQEQLLFGFHGVFNYTQYPTIEGTFFGVIPSPTVARRTRIITATSFRSATIPTSHQVRNLLPDPPSTQTLPIPTMFGLGSSFVNQPVVDNRTIAPTGFHNGFFGPTVVRGNVLFPSPILPLYAIGIPTLNPTQYITLGEWLVTSDEMNEIGKRPSVSPHTIYAPQGIGTATAQAINNHPGGNPGPIKTPSVFGTTVVTNQHRTIFPTWIPGAELPYHPRFGDSNVQLKVRRLYPTGVRSLRFGQVIFLNVPQYITLDEWAPGILSITQFGNTHVGPPYVEPVLGAQPIGLPSATYGTAHVENLHREVFPVAIPHRGNPTSPPPFNTNPWGDALIGYPREYVLTAGDQTLWGNPRVEHWIRELPVQGFDALLMSPEWTQFADRMRISQRNVPNSIPGVYDGAVGAPVVSNYLRGLPASGHSDSVAGTPSVREIQRVLPTGFHETEFGDIDEWVYGLLKTAGYDMSFVDYPTVSRTLPCEGFDATIYGDPRMAFRVQTYGMPEIGFDGPSVVRISDCGMRVIATGAGPGAEEIGVLEVDHA